MELLQAPRKGYAFLAEGGDIDELSRALNAGMIRHMPSPGNVPKVKGAVKAFSFHWSNAQAEWDVISIRDFPWGIDGAEFVLFVGRKAVSPTGRPWSLTEMRYVAKKLVNHPGFAFSVRGSLREAVIKLAHSKPDLRPHLLPLLKNQD